MFMENKLPRGDKFSKYKMFKGMKNRLKLPLPAP